MDDFDPEEDDSFGADRRARERHLVPDADVYAIREAIAADLARYLADHPPITYREGAYATRQQPRSMALLVAQFYWDDATDAVHVETLGSHRDAPAFPYEEPTARPGEPLPDFMRHDLTDHNLYEHRTTWEQQIIALEPFAPEGGDQARELNDNYRPSFVARRGEDGAITVALGYPPLRGWLDRANTRAPVMPLDPRVVPAIGTRVFADALLDVGDPRGEVIAHGGGDIQLQRSWLGELEPYVPRSGMRWRDGALDEVLVYCDAAPGLGDDLLPWAFRPALRFLAQSAVFWCPGMARCRSVGVVPAWWLGVVDRPTEIERLEVLADGPLDLRMFPRLRELVLVGAQPDARLPDVPYLEVTDDTPARWLGRPVHVSMFHAETNRAAGWIVDARTREIRDGGYHPLASRARRARLLP